MESRGAVFIADHHAIYSPFPQQSDKKFRGEEEKKGEGRTKRNFHWGSPEGHVKKGNGTSLRYVICGKKNDPTSHSLSSFLQFLVME